MSSDQHGKKPAARTLKAHCYRCGGQRTAAVLGHHRVFQSADDDSGLWCDDKHWILQCSGCEAVFYRHDHAFSEVDGVETRYWPGPVTRKTPKWAEDLGLRDNVLHQLLAEMYSAANGDLRVLAAIGARTVFDRASKILRVRSTLTFDAKLQQLLDDGRISSDEKEVLKTLVDAGSAAAHRAWRPTIVELGTMLDVVEAFLHRCFVLQAGVKRLKASVPRRKRR